jgi:hypothetical protein
MRRFLVFSLGAALGAMMLLLSTIHLSAQADPAVIVETGTIPPVAPILHNTDFECTTGYYTTTNAISEVISVPNHWQLRISEGSPRTKSTRLDVVKSCVETGAHVERIHGIDSMLIQAQDLERPPTPGKPFDVAIYQQVSATVGGAYSLSGWLLSLCGGSAVPNDCPEGYYMAKMLGIDPTGGVDPHALTVIWAEDRRNFVENDERVGWTNVRLAATAQAPTITVFSRIHSPFQWHGNHAFIDALGLVRAPVASLVLPAEITGSQVVVLWQGEQTPDVEAIPGANYHLYFDLQYRHEDETDWQDWLAGEEETGSKVFSARCVNTAYEFRIRARAQQPDDDPRAQPNQRYPGVWSEPVRVFFHRVSGASTTALGENQAFLPVIANHLDC